jgi:hypothetical protein
MKRFIIFLILLIIFCGFYNFSIFQASLYGFFGDSSYKKNDFLNADIQYNKAFIGESWSSLLYADILYNKGNTLYRLGEKEKDIEKIKFWKESIATYIESLSIRSDRDTEDNLAFVKDKLQKIEKEKGQEKQEKQKNNTKTGATSEKENKQSGDMNNPSQDWIKDGNKKWWNQITATGKNREDFNKDATPKNDTDRINKSKPGQNWSNGWNYTPIWWKYENGQKTDLSESEKEELKRYTDELKQFEKQNGKLLNPHKWDAIGSISEQIRQFFWSDSFFQDVLPDNGGKKDW